MKVETTAFQDVAQDIGAILNEKAKAYGDSYKTGGDFVRLLYPNGVPVEAYDDLLTMVRMFDKMKRVANNPGQADPGGEDPFQDVAGYAILAKVRRMG